MAKVEIEGLKELQLALLDLPRKVAKNVIRSVANSGAAIIRQEAKNRAPVYTGEVSQGHPPPGTLKRSIVTKYARELSDEFNANYLVTVRQGKKYQKQGKKGNLSQDAFYAQWVEYGHHYAPPGKSGYGSRNALMADVRSGKALVAGSQYVSPRPFMRPAFESKKQEALDTMMKKLSARIEEEAKK
jgi:HK97 gp10 family phage protein